MNKVDKIEPCFSVALPSAPWELATLFIKSNVLEITIIKTKELSLCHKLWFLNLSIFTELTIRFLKRSFCTFWCCHYLWKRCQCGSQQKKIIYACQVVSKIDIYHFILTIISTFKTLTILKYQRPTTSGCKDLRMLASV